MKPVRKYIKKRITQHPEVMVSSPKQTGMQSMIGVNASLLEMMSVFPQNKEQYNPLN